MAFGTVVWTESQVTLSDRGRGPTVGIRVQSTTGDTEIQGLGRLWSSSRHRDRGPGGDIEVRGPTGNVCVRGPFENTGVRGSVGKSPKIVVLLDSWSNRPDGIRGLPD